MKTEDNAKREKKVKLEDMLIKRAPNPFTFNYQYTVVLNRLNGALLELEGDLAALYQMLGDEWVLGSELSRLYVEEYGKSLNPAHIEALRVVEGLIYVKFR
ncbi:MAG: hypothetical protein HXS48_18080 [Theionarchaea archaeon]|nr:hypothetical protein [Theionarchaea archaeon]